MNSLKGVAFLMLFDTFMRS